MEKKEQHTPGLMAAEVVAEIYKKLYERKQKGLESRRVIMTKQNYELVQSFRTSLGDMQASHMDYIQKYSIFNLTVCIEDRALTVE